MTCTSPFSLRFTSTKAKQMTHQCVFSSSHQNVNGALQNPAQGQLVRVGSEGPFEP